MTHMYTFCTWFSLRKGSVIVATISIVQAIVTMVFTSIGILRSTNVSNYISSLLENNDIMFVKAYFIYLQKNFNEISTIVLIFNIAYIGSCVLLIYGSYKLREQHILPYTILEFIRLFVLSTLWPVLMIIMKKNVLQYDILIACSVSGGFILLFLYYLWLCPLSLAQCIKKVNNNKFISVREFANEKNQLSFYNDYASDLKYKPMILNRYYYQYEYGNLPKLNF